MRLWTVILCLTLSVGVAVAQHWRIDQSDIFDNGAEIQSSSRWKGKPPKPTGTNYLLAEVGGGYITTLAGERLLAQ